MEDSILSNYVPALRSELFVVALNKGGFFFINQFIPKGIEDFAEVDFKDDSNSVRLVANENLILVVDKIHNSSKGARNLRFVRFEREKSERQKLVFAEPKSFPKLREILRSSDRRIYNVLGGLDNAVIYNDEIAIQDEGPFGWILSLEETAKFIPENFKNIYFYVEHTKRGTARIIDEKEAKEKVSDFKLPKSRVQNVFKIGIDPVSRKVIEIISLVTLQKIDKVIVVSQFPPKHATIGETLHL